MIPLRIFHMHKLASQHPIIIICGVCRKHFSLCWMLPQYVRRLHINFVGIERTNKNRSWIECNCTRTNEFHSVLLSLIGAWRVGCLCGIHSHGFSILFIAFDLWQFEKYYCKRNIDLIGIASFHAVSKVNNKHFYCAPDLMHFIFMRVWAMRVLSHSHTHNRNGLEWPHRRHRRSGSHPEWIPAALSFINALTIDDKKKQLDCVALRCDYDCDICSCCRLAVAVNYPSNADYDQIAIIITWNKFKRASVHGKRANRSGRQMCANKASTNRWV